MSPQEFLLSSFQTVVPHPFRETRWTSVLTAERLCLTPDDAASLAKFRVCVISMVLALSLRGISEAFMRDYQDGFQSASGLISTLTKAATLFDALVTQEQDTAQWPAYAVGNYFLKWRCRYNEEILAPSAKPLRPTVLLAFLRQATFAYQLEDRVDATDVAILAQGEDVYDNYVIGLRNFLGNEVLR